MNATKRRIGRVAAAIMWPFTWITIQFTTRVRVLIVVKNEVLLVQNWFGTGNWTLPGGGLHRGEDPLKAAQREIKEELGIDVSLKNLKPLGRFRQTKAHRYKYYGYVLELSKKPKIIPAPNEITKAQWFDLSELKKLAIRQHTELLVETWLKQR